MAFKFSCCMKHRWKDYDFWVENPESSETRKCTLGAPWVVFYGFFIGNFIIPINQNQGWKNCHGSVVFFFNQNHSFENESAAEAGELEPEGWLLPFPFIALLMVGFDFPSTQKKSPLKNATPFQATSYAKISKLCACLGYPLLNLLVFNQGFHHPKPGSNHLRYDVPCQFWYLVAEGLSSRQTSRGPLGAIFWGSVNE